MENEAFLCLNIPIFHQLGNDIYMVTMNHSCDDRLKLRKAKEEQNTVLMATNNRRIWRSLQKLTKGNSNLGCTLLFCKLLVG